jgi:NodT family efflux transporter outer membrane factor (OMF) lipoprotein
MRSLNVSKPFRLWTAFLLISVLTAGCAVGPDFHVPAVAGAKTDYTSMPLPQKTAESPTPGGMTQRFVTGMEISSQWWTLFHSQPLDALIRQALEDSPTLGAAKAALIEARENRRAQLGAFFPSVDGNFTANRSEFTGASFGQPGAPGSVYTLYNASVSVSYTLDIFGATRRGLEVLQAQVDNQRFLLEGARLTLASNIVTTAVQEASLRAQIKATRDIIMLQEQQLGVVKNQFELGGVSRSDVLAQQAQLAQTRATLPPLEKQLFQTRHQLAVLAGKAPVEAGSLPRFDLDEFQLPQDLPVSLPSTLVRQRPDIRASEELLHSACAQIGVATANLFPQLTLSGNYGSESVKLENLFATGTSIWSLGGALLQPLFHGGTLLAKRRAAIAAYDQAAAQYRETVLQAFRDVADVLRALDMDAQTLKAQTEAESAARDSLALTRNQFTLGAVNYLSLLNAERQHQQALISLVQARAARFADTAALFQALGGGWWNRPAQTETTEKKMD